MWRIADRHARKRRILIAGAVVLVLAGGGTAFGVVRYSDRSTKASNAIRTVKTTRRKTSDVAAAKNSGRGTTTTTATPTTTTTTTTPTNVVSVPVQSVLPNPFLTSTMSSFVATRQGDVTAALFDAKTGVTYLYRPGIFEQTASIVKVDILATLLWDEQQQNQVPNAQQTALATGMIEQSDNDDATALWNIDGEAAGIARFNAAAGVSSIQPNYNWGETLTSALDEVELVKLVAYPNSVLDPASRNYELGLMENVATYEHWGVSAGPPANVTVALKNGWVPITGYNNWQINSIGFINGDDRQYVLAVLTSGDQSENYGISTIEGVSSIIWSELTPGTGPSPR